ncbi:GP46-like surface antigen, putative [Bodo saltans]|uniref:GP46-like surface antigen, putative n=1 Tax=Bodo saltans TaxID=75058 RepID=A0A0S4IX99_BODSA|nr:GP46-like surface antigen, putative [Bodo saltans]|eukprot:CUG03278.1 GP46-like surface antigen, putative [Bodo saltans]
MMPSAARMTLFFVVIVCWIVSLTIMTVNASSSLLERSALVDFYHATNGPTWAISTGLWAVADNSSNYCSGAWFGVQCVNGSSGVVSLSLINSGLSGTISTSIGNLSLLETFAITNNRVAGTLPDSFSFCTRMSVLDIDTNLLSGTLPSSFSAMQHMTRFLVLNNAFTGTLPTDYKAWTNITRFAPQNNLFTGTLPREYAAWTSLEAFDLEFNSFAGTLPPEYGPAWQALRYFTVRYNNCSGTLPLSYGNWTRLLEFMVNDNPLIEGTLPPEYGRGWQSISQIFIYNTKVSGSIPNDWGMMKTATNVFLFGNRLTGTLPASVGNMSKLATFNVALNSLSGTVPFESWSSLRSIQAMVLQDNPLLVGDVPATSAWNIFNMSSGLPAVFSICRTNICGPQLAVLALYGGYMCVPPGNLSLLSSVTLTTIPLLFGVMKTSQTVECSTGTPAPVAHQRTKTVSHAAVVPVVAYPPFTSAAAATSKAASSVIVSIIALQQLVPGVSNAAGLRMMQSTLILQRLRQHCVSPGGGGGSGGGSGDDGNSATTSSSTDVAGDDTLCCDSATSPTQLSIPMDYANDPLAGAIVGNTFIVVVVAALRIAGQFLVWRFLSSMAESKNDANSPKKDSMAQKFIFKPIRSIFESCWGVALIWPMFTVLLTPTVTVAVALLVIGKTSGVAFGVAFLVLWLCPWVVSTYGVLYSGAPRPSPAVNFKRRPLPGESRLLRVRRYVLEPKEELVLPRGGSRTFIQNFGPVFAPFRAARLWYFNVELTFSLINGVLTGVALGAPLTDICTTILVVGWLLVAAGVLECLSAFVIVPYSARIDLISLFVVNGLSVLSQVLALIDDSDAAQNASASIGVAASMFQLLLTIALTIDAILTSVLSTSGSGSGNNSGERVMRGITLRKEVQLGCSRPVPQNNRRRHDDRDGATLMSLSSSELKSLAPFSTFFEFPDSHAPHPPLYGNLESLIQAICKAKRKSQK